MKIFLTGAAGMLAADVIKVLLTEGHELVQTDINQRLPEIEALDVRKKEEVFRHVEKTKPDYFFHLAAETNVDLCEKEPDHAFLINTIGTENIALACQKYNVKMLYISTGGVFNGEKADPYTEFDEPDPVSVYGKSKLEGEIIIRNLLYEYFIVRAGWMIGGWELDKKFVYKIVQQIKEGKKELKVVSDKFGSPTFTRDFAENIMNLIGSGQYGLYHMANRGTCSRYEIALKIVEFMGMKDEVSVLPVNSAQFPLPAPRARSEMMQNYKLELIGLNNMPVWEKSLEEYIKSNRNK